MKKEKDLWMNNFSGMRIGYRLCGPWSGWGIAYCQKVFYGKQHITKHFAHHVGPDLLGGYFKKDELRTLINETLRIIFEKPKFVEKIHREAEKLNKEYFDYAKTLLKLNLTSLSNNQLAQLVDELTYKQELAHAHAVTTTWFVESDGQDLTNKLIELTEKYVKESRSKIKVSEVFSVLTTPHKVSLLNQEEIESLEVVKSIISNKKSLDVFKNLTNYDAIPATIDDDLKKKILKHFNKWQWTPYGYMGPSYKIADYLKAWQEKIKEGIDPEKEIEEKKERPIVVRAEKNKLKKELKINALDRSIFEVSADIVFLKGYRKDCLFHGCFVLDKLYGEIGRRTHLSSNQLQVMSYLEIIHQLKSKKHADVSQINERLKKDSVILHLKGNIKILSGKKAELFLKKENDLIEKEVVDLSQKEFKGVCACHGYAKGTVKIINTSEEMKKMEEGDVMVSHTTFPALVPAMKKASAIITEDGGVTCHAAIVSRELKTPCVTGIKVLTKVLKDGDLVEVDADKGTVRILNEK